MKHRMRRSGVENTRRSTRRSGLALVYHRVGSPAGNARSELVPALDPRPFEAQLDHLRTSYRIVAPSQLQAAALARGRGEKLPVALTFDDDLRSHVDVVAPALKRADLPAAFFLCGATLDGGHGFWWDDLETLVNRGFFEHGARISADVDFDVLRGGAPGAIQAVAERIERLSPKDRDAIAAELRAHVRTTLPALAASDISALIAAGFEIGFHTRRHYLLPALDDRELGAAMTEGRNRLDAIAERKLTMIAYPHGKADERVAQAAQEAGFELGFTGLASPVTPTTDPLLIGRLDAQAVPAADFERVVAETLMRG
jgi:peptidoglycan/xylan/chitin deacetylase (PgdA/CDA1 family)